MLSTEEAIALEKRFGAANYAPLPVVLSRAQGCYVWDPEGNRYLDFLSGICSVSQGHCHPKIIEALVRQATRLTLTSRAFYSDVYGLFAQALSRYFGYDRVLAMNTGVEAVETALKLCRKWGYRKKEIPEAKAKILFCTNAFHGRTLGAVSASSSADSAFGPFLPGLVGIPFDDLEALARALEDPTVAGFLVEPIQGEGGVVVPAEGYLAKAQALCRASNVLFIADEIQTGIGRTGRRLACDYEGVKPDILLLGKALSGGVLPVSAVLADDPVMLVFQPGDHGSTFGGNPLACSVAMAALEVVEEEGLAENAARMGELFRAELRALGTPAIAEVRGKGLLNAIALAPGLDAFELCLRLKARGVLAKNTRDRIVRFAPPLGIEEATMREAIAIIVEVVKGL